MLLRAILVLLVSLAAVPLAANAQQARPGDGTLFRDVADDEHRHARPLGQKHELAGHFLHLERPHVVNARIVEFLQ